VVLESAKDRILGVDEGQSFLSGATLFHRDAVGSGAFSGGARPPGLDI
jgi:hypothetical protein